MITVTARINISGDGNGTIERVEGNSTMAPHSASSEFYAVLNRTDERVASPFVLGGTRLGDSGKFVSKVPYFTSKILSDSYGNIAGYPNITITGSNIEHVVIVFDKQNDAHPKSVTEDGNTITDDEAVFEIPLDASLSEHKIFINGWNKPHSPIVITSIYADINIDIDERSLVDFDSSITDRDSADYPSYGIISNSASLTCIDYDTSILDMIQQKILHSGLSVSITLNNTTANTQEQLAETRIRELSYDNDNRQVNLTLKDNLEDWQEINVEAINYDWDNVGAKPFSTLYNKLWQYTVAAGFDMQTIDEVDDLTWEVLTNTKIEYFVLEGGTLWDCWQKLCEALHLHIFMNESGKVVCKYSK